MWRKKDSYVQIIAVLLNFPFTKESEKILYEKIWYKLYDKKWKNKILFW